MILQIDVVKIHCQINNLVLYEWINADCKCKNLFRKVFKNFSATAKGINKSQSHWPNLVTMVSNSISVTQVLHKSSGE